MSIPRLFLDQDLAAGREIPASPAQAHYLGGVMRRAVGDPVLLFNGRDGEWQARIATLRKDRALLLPERLLRPQAAEPELRLLVAALKRDAMELVAEKATELGATLIQPVLTRRCVAVRAKAERLASIAQEAAEQCERLTLPRIGTTLPLHAVLDAWETGTGEAGVPLLVAAERRQAPPIAEVAQRLCPPFGLLVGPEGGFERAELDDVLRRPFVSPVALGPRILRAETAAIAGIAVLQALAGDWPLP